VATLDVPAPRRRLTKAAADELETRARAALGASR
jgi:hypothetical protein